MLLANGWKSKINSAESRFNISQALDIQKYNPNTKALQYLINNLLNAYMQILNFEFGEVRFCASTSHVFCQCKILSAGFSKRIYTCVRQNSTHDRNL